MIPSSFKEDRLAALRRFEKIKASRKDITGSDDPQQEPGASQQYPGHSDAGQQEPGAASEEGK
jgi:hypothetical protein